MYLIQQANYDIYLQLALGYLINRSEDVDEDDETVVQTGDINNFIDSNFRCQRSCFTFFYF